MIPNLSIILIILTAFICFAFPVIGFMSLRKNHKGLTGVLVGGMLSFYLTQIVVRIPLLQLVFPKFQWYQTLATHPLMIALFLGLTAALFETFGRSLTLNLLLKKSLSYKSGLVHGIGHGGIEAILLVGLNYIIFAVYGLLLNRGNPSPLLFLVPEQQQELVRSLLIDTPSSLFFIAGLERLFTMILHIALSLMIVIGIYKKKQVLYTGIVITLHTFVDTGAVLMVNHGYNTWVIEGFIALFAIASGIIIFAYRHTIPTNPIKDDGEEAVDEGY